MSGDSQLRALQQKIAGLAREAVQRQLGARLARVGLEQVRVGVRASRDPYGRPFAPLAGSNRAPLRRIIGVFSAGAEGGGFGIRAGRDYVRYHQEGAIIPARRHRPGERSQDLKSGRFLSAAKASKRKLVAVVKTATSTRAGILPQRQLVPEPSTGGMGPIWGAAINDSADAWMRDYVER